MTWWYENEEEEMKLYKNEDLCIGCKNAFFSKPYDHRDPTPGQLGYCIKCDNCLIKERKMEFLRERVYTALNADELKQGDKVITARCMADLKTWVEADAEPNIIELIQDETNTDRFTCKCHGSNKTYDSPLAYLVERAENCTNCGAECDDAGCKGFECATCEDWKPKTEQKAEKHYRPFKDTDELIKVWCEKYNKAYGSEEACEPLFMPHIWVQDKESGARLLITIYKKSWFSTETKCGSMEALFNWYTFLDGSPCGVEE